MFAKARLEAERLWYRDKRPFFNVYPLIESKFIELSEDLRMSELVMPYQTLEVRTKDATMLLTVTKKVFLIVLELGKGAYQEFACPKSGTVRDALNAGYVEKPDEDWGVKYEMDPEQSIKNFRKCIKVAVGTCMLAQDSSIIAPVILNQHRKESMTPAEIADYAQRAVNRTGRIGFDVGRDIERMKATVHYRNGCFAKYYVGKTHSSYPKNAEADLVPVIIWRSGAVVNKDNTPEVPTGFKDSAESIV